MDKLNMAESAVEAVRQHFDETEEERETRALGRFPEFEQTMPLLRSRFSSSFIENVTSYFGSKNPFYHNVDPDKHAVWLFDNTAYHKDADPAAPWQAEFVAAYFVKNSGRDLSRIVADISEKIGLGEGDAAEATIAERLQPFIDTILPAHSVTVDVGGKELKRLGPSGRNGISSDVLPLHGTYAAGESVLTRAINLPAADPATTAFAAPTGWAIISDIDDTIKKTLTSSPVGILATTFAEEPQPIANMPELYAHLTKILQDPPFFYLSASPYSLYPFLRAFRGTYYPPGTIILRDASWMDLAGLLASLTRGTQSYKVDRMAKIHGWLPRRRFICIGDSTQTDPESYAEVYKRFPGWVGAIFIRRVKGVAEMDESGKNRDERFEKAFKGVPRGVWYVFDDPREIYAKVEELVAGA